MSAETIKRPSRRTEVTRGVCAKCERPVRESHRDVVFRPLDAHAHRLASLLYAIKSEQIADWFDLAAGIVRVEFSAGAFDPSTIGLCESADAYDDARDSLRQECVLQIARFTVAWSGIEALIDEVLPNNYRRRREGKIEATARWLGETMSRATAPLDGYATSVQQFRACVLAGACSQQSQDRVRNLGPNILSDPGGGLKAVYAIRNELAHGASSLPEPDEWRYSTEGDLEPSIVLRGQRIVLLTAQMLLHAGLGDIDIDWWPYGSNDEDEHLLRVRDIALRLHVVP
jgi:hypothetical protein